MENGTVPYLCGGTFLCQVLRARKPTATAADHVNGNKESLSEQETFRRLISIYQLEDFLGGPSLKTYTSDFKSCQKSLAQYTRFTDSDLQRKFDSDVRAGDSDALRMMWDFVNEFIDVEGKGEQIVRCLLGLIKDDDSILPDDSFILDGKSVAKRELITKDRFAIEPFLLGVWHYIIMKRAEKNGRGADTYKSWYVGRNDYRGTVGGDILYDIKVSSVSLPPPVVEADTVTDAPPESGVEDKQNVQHIEHATIVNQYGEKCYHFDHVDVLNL